MEDLSPLVFLGDNPKLFTGIIIAGIVLYNLMPYMNKWNKAYSKKKGGEEVEFKGAASFIFLYALMLAGFFVGTAIGDGPDTRDELKNGDFMLTHELTFSDDSKTLVRKIRNNSQYIFYVKENATQISISPINGNIKKIEPIREVEIEKKKELSKQK